MKYIFVLGNMRSGTSWVSRVIAQSPIPLRYFEEPFVKLKRYPKTVCKEPWSVHINDSKKIKYYRNLLKTFETDFGVFKKDVVGISVLQNSDNPEYFVIKEVHNIPAFRKIVDGLDCKIVFTSRNPFRVLDSNLHNFGDGLRIYMDEYIWLHKAVRGNIKIKDKCYLKALESLNSATVDFIKEPIFNKDRYIQFFIVLLFNQRVLNYWDTESENTYMIQYEELCSDKITGFKNISDFIGFPFGDNVSDFLKNCSEVDNRKDPYSILRNKYLVGNAKYKFLTDEQIKVLGNFYGV